MLMVTTIDADPRGPNVRLFGTVAGLATTHELVIVLPRGGDRAELVDVVVDGLRERLPRFSIVALHADEAFIHDRAALGLLTDLLEQGAVPVVVTGDTATVATALADHIGADAQCELSAEVTGRVFIDYFPHPHSDLLPELHQDPQSSFDMASAG